MLGSGAKGSFVPAASWPVDEQNLELLAESGRIAARQRSAVVQPQSPPGSEGTAGPVIVAFPLLTDGELLGVVALEVNTLDQQQQRTLLQLLQWGSAWLHLLSQEDGSAAIASRLANVVEVTAKALDQSSLRAAATAAVNHLANLLSCERVSLGLLHNRSMRVQVVSNSAQFDRRTALLRGIEAAMDEALDEKRAVVHPPVRISEIEALPAHERLCRGNDGAAACTVLLLDENQAIGALTFERQQGPPFDRDELDLCDAVVALLGPIFELKRLQDRPLLAKAGQTIAGVLGGIFGRRHLLRRLLIAGSVAMLVVLALANGEFRISATAVLEGTEQRALVAPIDGYVAQARARAGEFVKQGAVLAALDDRDLKLERRRWLSERDDLTKQHRRAFGTLDRAQAAIVEAQLGKANAQLSLIEAQLARTRIVAPFDGVIVRGDLSQSLGVPVERGQILFELAPLDTYRIALQVNEGDITHIAAGQQGVLALAALPDERLPFQVEDIIGIATTDEGRNGFRVEGGLEAASAKFRPGMRGVGKIVVGERSLLWIWTHSLADRVGLWLWSRLP